MAVLKSLSIALDNKGLLFFICIIQKTPPEKAVSLAAMSSAIALDNTIISVSYPLLLSA